MQTLTLSVNRTRTSFHALTQMLGINFSFLHAVLCCRLLTFFKKLFEEHYQSVKWFVGPDLGQDCLQKLSAGDKSLPARKELSIKFAAW